MIKDIKDLTSFKWATVTGTSPLAIKLDGDSAPLALIPDSLVDPARLVVGDRVRVELSLRKVVIHGKANGSPDLQLMQRVSSLESRVQGVIPSSVDITVGGTATVDEDGTIWFSGVSRVSLNDVFDGVGSDIYQIVSEGSGSGAALTHELRAAGVDNPGGVLYERSAVYSTLTTGPTRSVGDGVTNFGYVVPTGSGGANRGNGTMVLANPSVANNLSYVMSSSCRANNTQYQWSEAGRSTGGSVSIYDGISFFCSAGVMTGRMKVVKL